MRGRSSAAAGPGARVAAPALTRRPRARSAARTRRRPTSTGRPRSWWPCSLVRPAPRQPPQACSGIGLGLWLRLPASAVGARGCEAARRTLCPAPRTGPGPGLAARRPAREASTAAAGGRRRPPQGCLRVHLILAGSHRPPRERQHAYGHNRVSAGGRRGRTNKQAAPHRMPRCCGNPGTRARPCVSAPAARARCARCARCARRSARRARRAQTAPARPRRCWRAARWRTRNRLPHTACRAAAAARACECGLAPGALTLTLTPPRAPARRPRRRGRGAAGGRRGGGHAGRQGPRRAAPRSALRQPGLPGGARAAPRGRVPARRRRPLAAGRGRGLRAHRGRRAAAQVRGPCCTSGVHALVRRCDGSPCASAAPE